MIVGKFFIKEDRLLVCYFRDKWKKNHVALIVGESDLNFAIAAGLTRLHMPGAK